MPNVPEQYVHRIGRTARAGADGISVSFVAPDEKPYLRDIERLTGVKLMPQPLPADFAREAARLPAPSRKPAEAEQDARRDTHGRGGRGRQGQAPGHGNSGRGGQGRDGQSRDASLRNDRRRRQGERGPIYNPLGDEARGSVEHRPARSEGDRRHAPQGDRRPARAEGESGQQRQPRRRGGPGGWRGKARQAS
jgi:ATP-dependent RNA helicase RhlE